MRLASSATTAIVCVPVEIGHAPPPVPMVTGAPAASGPLTAPQVHFTPSTLYATPMGTNAGVAALPWLATTLVKLPLVLLYEIEVGIRSGSPPPPPTVIV